MADMLDTVAVIETPEGVVLRLVPAGIVPRALAKIVDALVLGVGQLLIFSVLALAEGIGSGIAWIISFAMQWLYPVLCEVLWNGQTVGKRTLGLVVLHDDGSPVRLPASAVRNLMLAMDMVLSVFVAAVCMLSTRRFQRLGDLAAGTMVVHADRAAAATTLPSITPRSLPQALSQDEQKLLLAFAERAPRLSVERQRELADLLQPLHDETGDQAVAAVQGMAASIVGSA